MTFDGLARSYLLVRPTVVPAGRKLPLLVVLHGVNATPEIELARDGFLPLAQQGAAILVYPAGYDEAWNAGACCRAPGAPVVDDVGFIEAVMHAVLSDQPVDSKEVYLVGYSNGGKMVYRVACADSGLFDGYAAVEAVAVTSCPDDPVGTFMEVVSTGDPEIAYSVSDPPTTVNGYQELPAQAQIDLIGTLNECAASTASSTTGSLTISTFTGCAEKSKVTLATYAGGNHAWPQGGPGTPSAEQIIWSFFTGGSFL
jgi:polyhydroxybutyrate depolymerase